MTAEVARKDFRKAITKLEMKISCQRRKATTTVHLYI